MEEKLREKAVLDDDEEPPNRPYYSIKNPPQYWVDDPGAAMPFQRALEMQMARMGLWKLSEEEYEAEEELLNEDQYKPALLRQSAFFEDYLTLRCQLEFQGSKEDTLTNNEMKMVAKMGHKPRVRMARVMVILNKKEHDLLLNMAGCRNELAHNSWTDFTDDDESHFKDVAERIHKMLKEWMDEAEEAAEEPVREEVSERTSTTENLRGELATIAVLTPLSRVDNPVLLSHLATLSGYPETSLEAHCDALIQQGLVEKVGEKNYRITPQGIDEIE